VPGEEDATPYFSPDFALYPETQFEASVVLKIKGESRTIKGFQNPPLVPPTYAAAVAKLEAVVGKLEEWARARNVEALHGAESRLVRLCSGIRNLAPEGRKAPAVKACQDVVESCRDWNRTLQSKEAVVSPAAFDRIRLALHALKNP
jgi:hypothetical protein